MDAAAIDESTDERADEAQDGPGGRDPGPEDGPLAHFAALVAPQRPSFAPEASGIVPILERQPPERHPVAIYLTRLAPGSRRAMASALEAIAAIASVGAADARTLPWSALRYPHVQALRAALSERYAPSTVNRHLSALRGVLGEAWKLGQMDTDSYQRAIAVEGVRGSRMPAGRDVSMRERQKLFDVWGSARGRVEIYH